MLCMRDIPWQTYRLKASGAAAKNEHAVCLPLTRSQRWPMAHCCRWPFALILFCWITNARSSFYFNVYLFCRVSWTMGESPKPYRRDRRESGYKMTTRALVPFCPALVPHRQVLSQILYGAFAFSARSGDMGAARFAAENCYTGKQGELFQTEQLLAFPLARWHPVFETADCCGKCFVSFCILFLYLLTAKACCSCS